MLKQIALALVALSVACSSVDANDQEQSAKSHKKWYYLIMANKERTDLIKAAIQIAIVAIASSTLMYVFVMLELSN